KFIIETHTLINISPDSLNQILQNKTIQSIEIQGNQNFQITELNSFPKSSSRYKAEYLNSIPYFEVIPPNIQRDTFIADQSYKAQIEALQRQIRQIWRNDKSAVMKYQAVQDQIQNLKSQFKKTEDITLKQTLIEEIKELEKIKAPQKQGNKVEALKTEIRKIRRENRLKNEVKRQEIKSAIATSESNRQSTQILGFIKFVSWQN
ncbi:MAG: hypothetical protein P1U70_18300, partial [Saprospiraceae bacterium]|nr:hypothetical protein [Saprospiraceae bacterium]